MKQTVSKQANLMWTMVTSIVVLAIVSILLFAVSTYQSSPTMLSKASDSSYSFKTDTGNKTGDSLNVGSHGDDYPGQ